MESLSLSLSRRSRASGLIAACSALLLAFSLTACDGGGGSGGDNQTENINDADFGAGAIITNEFNVVNLSDWNSAKSAIVGDGGYGNYIININENVAGIGGVTSATFGNAGNIKVSIRGSKLLGLGSAGALLYIGANQSVILRGVSLTGKSGNSESLLYINGSGASFIMHSGVIVGNTLSVGHGGGVAVGNGTFTMSGGTISGNGAYDHAGGVFINGGAFFIMRGGTIKNNTAKYGGGVAVYSNGTFTMSGGTISGNATTMDGGGVDVNDYGTFNMSGGTISGNRAEYYGGGVLVYTYGNFAKSGNSVIYGSNASASLRNTAGSGDSKGHAVYVNNTYTGIGGDYRSSTAGSGVNLSVVNGTTAGSGWNQ